MSKKQAASEADLLKAAITKALRPGTYLEEWQLFKLLNRLDLLLHDARALPDPSQAAEVQAFLLTGMLAKEVECEHLDDGSPFKDLAVTALTGWFDSREQYAAPIAEAAPVVAEWLVKDEFDALQSAMPAVLLAFADCLAEFERALLARFDPMDVTCLDDYLREVHVLQKDPDKYIALTRRTFLRDNDDARIVQLLEQAGRAEEALAWAQGAAACKAFIAPLLAKLGRADDAARIALERFQRSPGADTYDNLMATVPLEKRPEVHEQAMQSLERGDLRGVIEVCVAVGEKELLARRIGAASDASLRNLGHSGGEPAAKMLTGSAPKVAARTFHILALGILDASKSDYYRIALDHLARAKECLERAGDHAAWQRIAEQIERDHYRKMVIRNAFPTVKRGRWTLSENLTSQRSSTSRE